VGSVVLVLQELMAAIVAEAVAPENADGTGGTSFAVEVYIGDEHLNRLQGQLGRVVLCVGDGAVGPSQRMHGLLDALCTVSKTIEAHLWAPIGSAPDRTSLLRYDAIESLEKVVLRAWHGTIVNANTIAPGVALGAAVRLNRDEMKLRNGQAEIVELPLTYPVCRGRTLTTLPAGTRGRLNLTVNPEAP